ncbi:23S rRNA (pseudouridine-1915-N(3)-) methyltransferase [Alkalispirillum mobile]|uniref:Ribosomal RNA large subunit methyltransferase H n=1 Tax=Alkalispirillum mobile TaxID=85925 RepID=A0A498CA47_9GAMM|nr:23S rRNA (pseudouridine(1915)-N(3))-methyltransferase RlmH [Alkalispirillum mobile]RLK51336.1 23S rRNA (pseudouridine-1915-N(3)-) methyltransferase [Alkalispirillum mobile]
MRIRLISVGGRMPAWAADGYQEYAQRLGAGVSLELVEIPLGRRGKGADPRRALDEEGRRMLKALGDEQVVALDVRGKAWDTPALSRQLDGWLHDGRDLALLVGGPDGLHPDCVARANQRWSLSPLTFPHMLVRVVLAEQLYRAWSLLQGHPYHRA